MKLRCYGGSRANFDFPIHDVYSRFTRLRPPLVAGNSNVRKPRMEKFTITLRRARAPFLLRSTRWRPPRQNMALFGRTVPSWSCCDRGLMVPVGIQAHRHGKLQSWGIYRKLPAPGDPLSRVCAECDGGALSQLPAAVTPAGTAHLILVQPAAAKRYAAAAMAMLRRNCRCTSPMAATSHSCSTRCAGFSSIGSA